MNLKIFGFIVFVVWITFPKFHESWYAVLNYLGAILIILGFYYWIKGVEQHHNRNRRND